LFRAQDQEDITRVAEREDETCQEKQPETGIKARKCDLRRCCLLCRFRSRFAHQGKCSHTQQAGDDGNSKDEPQPVIQECDEQEAKSGPMTAPSVSIDR
jgi:hypothetical protein